MCHQPLHSWPRARSQRAFSFAEALVAIAIIGLIAAVAIPYSLRVQEDVQEERLMSAVAQLNQSLSVYHASGGNVKGLTDPQEVVDKLKTQRNPDAAARFAGFAGSMVDPRLQVVPLSQNQIPSARLRAIWNADNQRFELTTENVAGIANFVLVESAAAQDYGNEEREESVISYNTQDGWIWGYQDSSATEPASPSRVPLSDTVPQSLPPQSSGEGNSAAPAKLSPPQFSLPSDYYPLTGFPLSLKITNPNSTWESQVYYRKGREGPFLPYYGQTLSVELDERVYAYIASLNTKRYRNSLMQGEHYSGKPVQLELALESDQDSYSYFDLIDAPRFATARITNLDEIPESMRNDIRIYWASDGANPKAGESGQELAAQTIPLTPSSWKSQTATTLTVMAEGSLPYVESSELQSCSFQASVMTLESPLIEAVAEKRGTFEITLGTSGRVPAGSKIYYQTDGNAPTQDEKTGAIGGTLYEGPFRLVLEEKPIVPSGTPYEGNSGPVAIKQVVLRFNNADVVQNSPVTGKTVTNSSSGSVALKGMTLTQDGKEVALAHLNTLNVAISNVAYPDNSQNVSIYRGGSRVARPSDSNFAAQLTTTMKSADLRDYVDYGKPSVNNPQNYFVYDISFSPVYNTDFLVVSERNGDNAFSLTPLGPDGSVIAGSSTVTFDSYSWNTGYAPSDKKKEPFVLSAIDVEQFAVNTDEVPITGFRVTNFEGADIKFFTASDKTFDERKVKQKVTYTPAMVTARAFPPESLSGWFEPSTAGMAEIRDEIKSVAVNFTLLSSSAGYLNKATLYVNGEAYDFGNSDMGAGYQLSVDIDVNPFASNRFDLDIDTWKRSGDWIHGLDTRDGTGFDLIGANESFAGASEYVAKIKDLSYESQIHMIVGYEDLIKTGGTPDYDYNDFLFEFSATEAFSFLFGDQVWGNSSSTVGTGTGSSAYSDPRSVKSNNGHGNNLDGVDSSNPGQGSGGPTGANNSGNDPSGGVDDEAGLR